MRFSVRTYLIVVVLVGMNLAAALATASHYPRRKFTPGGYSANHGFILHTEDGRKLHYRGDFESGLTLARVEYLPSPPSLLRIWRPVIASTTTAVGAIAFLSFRAYRGARHTRER